jgi:hypothetical protein
MLEDPAATEAESRWHLIVYGSAPTKVPEPRENTRFKLYKTANSELYDIVAERRYELHLLILVVRSELNNCRIGDTPGSLPK